MAGLYSSFSTSQYYDESDKPAKKQEKPVEQSHKKPHQPDVAPDYGLTPTKRKSLYEEAQKIVTTATEYDHIDFQSLYRVGQMVAIQDMKGNLRTAKGRVVEIVNRDLMYVGMEDSHKDVHGQWLIDFVTSSDIITKL